RCGGGRAGGPLPRRRLGRRAREGGGVAHGRGDHQPRAGAGGPVHGARRMRGWILARRLVRDHRRGFVGWSTGIVVLVALVVWAYPSIGGTNGYAEVLQHYPEALKAMFGLSEGDLGSGAGYLHAELFSLML